MRVVLFALVAAVFLQLVLVEHSNAECCTEPQKRPAILWARDCNPWGYRDTYIATLDLAWGSGNWDMFDYDTPVETIFGASALYIEGSNYCTFALKDWVDSNADALGAYIRKGGRVWINFATNEAYDPFCLGDSGICTQYGPSGEAYLVSPTPEFLTSPYPVVDYFEGDSASHNKFTGGPSFEPLVIGQSDNLGYITLGQQVTGSGLLVVSGFTCSQFWTPSEAAFNLNANILNHLYSARVSKTVTVRLEHAGKVLLTPSLLSQAGLDVSRVVEICPPFVSCQDVDTQVLVKVDCQPKAYVYVKDSPHSGCSDVNPDIPGKDEVKH